MTEIIPYNERIIANDPGRTSNRLDEDPRPIKAIGLEDHLRGALDLAEIALTTDHEINIYPIDTGISVQIPDLEMPKIQNDQERAGYLFLGRDLILDYDRARKELVYKGRNEAIGRDFYYSFKLTQFPNIAQKIEEIDEVQRESLKNLSKSRPRRAA